MTPLFKEIESEEVESLRQQLQTLKELFKTLRAAPQDFSPRPSPPPTELFHENERLKQQLELTKQLVEQKDQRLLNYQVANEELIAKVEDAKTKLDGLEKKLQLSDKGIKEANSVADAAERKEKEAVEETRALHAQLEAIKTKFVGLQDSLRKEEKEKQELQMEHSCLLQQYQAIKELFSKSEERLLAAQEGIWERDRQLEILQATQEQLHKLSQAELAWQEEQRKLLNQNKSHLETIEQKEERILYLQHSLEATQKHLQEVLSDKHQMQEAISLLRNAEDDAEKRLKIAQQHLAKKVRESTELQDSLDIQEKQLHDVNTLLHHAQQQINDLQHLAEEHSQQETRRQKQFEESLKSAEALTVTWEDKYSKLYDRLQENESRLADLKKIEEKYRLMQSAWAGLGSCFHEADPHAAEEISGRKGPKRPYQNLFDLPKMPPIYGEK